MITRKRWVIAGLAASLAAAVAGGAYTLNTATTPAPRPKPKTTQALAPVSLPTTRPTTTPTTTPTTRPTTGPTTRRQAPTVAPHDSTVTSAKGSGPLGPSRIQYGPTYTGEGTYYGATGEGNCMYGATSDRMIAAMNHLDYQNSSACGAYVQVTGPNGTALAIKIVDQCPECKPGDLDLSQEAFAKLAPRSAGRIKISWHLLSPALPGPVVYKYKDGSSPYWCGIQVSNHRNPLRTLEAKVNGAWQNLPRHDFNYFISVDGSGCGKEIRVTDIYGHHVVDAGITISPGVAQRGRSQFGPPK